MKNRRKPQFFNEVEIIDAGSEGKAVAKPENQVVFVPFAAPGDIVDLEVIRKKKNYFEGKILQFHRYSDLRTEPECMHFGLCGGCKWQHMDYVHQLYFKQKQVKDNLDRIAKVGYPEIRPILAAPQAFYYRNKLEYTFSNRKWFIDGAPSSEKSAAEMNGLGFHLPGMFDRILDIDYCHLQPDPSNEIRLFVRKYAIDNGLSFYDVRNHEGLLRNLIIRNTSAGAFMVILVIHHEDEMIWNGLLPALEENFPAITSLMLVLNDKKNDVINDLEVKRFSGGSFLVEKMASPRDGFAELEFEIGPVSFYQTNALQAERLYRAAFDMVQLKGDERVYDLYTGTGTIALYFARFVKEVIGIEYVEQAVKDAVRNAKRNQIDNVRFYAGDMAAVLDETFIAEQGKADLIITDPPRAGMQSKVVAQLLAIEAPRILYISCNPATQARDINMLNEKYKLIAVQPVDMFPQTQHVENIALLEFRTA
jgi:23S rRNA (uracil1939-C5)-methyltransferase